MGLMQVLGEGVLRLLADRLLPASARMVDQVARLAREGKDEEALELVERDAGLTSEVYADPGLLAARLVERLREENPDLAAMYVATLAGALGMAGRREHALAVFEAHMGIGAEDYSNPSRLAVRLHEELDSLMSEFALGFLLAYTGVLGMVERHADGLAILQADLGLERAAEETQVSEALKRRLEGVMPDLAATYALAMASVFTVVGQKEEGVWLLQSYLGLDASDYRDPDLLVRKVRACLEMLQPDSAAGLILFLAMNLESVGQLPAFGFVMEGHIDLSSAVYGSPERLAACLESRLGSLRPVMAANYVLMLSLALSAQGRIADSLALLRAYGGEEIESLRLRLSGWPAELSATYVRCMAATLEEARDSVGAVALLEGYAGLRPEDYRSPGALAARLAVVVDPWTENAAAAYVFELLCGLQFSGEVTKAAVLVETYVEVFGRVADRKGGDHALVSQLVPIYDAWLAHFGADPGKRPLEVCRGLIQYLRKNLDTQGVHLKDRIDFIAYTAGLRRQIVDVGHFWAQHTSDHGQAKRIWFEVQLWDAELTQRLLVERFLLEPILPVQKGVLPAQVWPWSTETERPDSLSHLPEPELVRQSRGNVEEGVQEAVPSQDRPGELTRLQRERPRLFQRARQVVREGVDEARLAQAIGAGGVLLRALFGSEGQLLWTALRSNGVGIEVAERGVGEPDDLEHLRWAAARHDFRMALAHLPEHTKKVPGTRERVLAVVDQALEELLFELGPGARPEDVQNRLVWISQRFLSEGGKHRQHLLRFLIPVFGPLQTLSQPDRFSEWATRAAGHLSNLRAWLSKRAPEGSQSDLNRITDDYIERVGAVWKLDELAQALSPEVDLLVQVDDTLHTVPIAHLSVGGRPLFQQVRSIRSSLALLMTSLQLETEQEVGEEKDETQRLLSVSHLASDDGAALGAVWLHHAFSILAASRLHAYFAAETPAGSVGLLRSALEELRRFRVLAICGHGDLFQSGIALSELKEGAVQEGQEKVRLWEGGGCDLSGVDWLWMVSCSIGRLGQNGDRDVEGFCVRLALHRARSVAAFRWPVRSLEAVSLVNESVRLYLEALLAGDGTDSRCLRARALNDARKSFFGDGSVPPLFPHVGLNTAAACELFGLG